MKIKIGADELILWLRKNKIAAEIPNDGINGLGIEIYNIIKGLGGDKIIDNDPVYWPNVTSPKIGQYELPKTSAQYEIDTAKLPELYIKLSQL